LNYVDTRIAKLTHCSLVYHTDQGRLSDAEITSLSAAYRHMITARLLLHRSSTACVPNSGDLNGDVSTKAYQDSTSNPSSSSAGRCCHSYSDAGHQSWLGLGDKSYTICVRNSEVDKQELGALQILLDPRS